MKKAPYEKQDWCTAVSRLLKKIVAQCTVIVTDLVFFGLQKTLHISVSQKLTFSTNFLPDLLTLFSCFTFLGCSQMFEFSTDLGCKADKLNSVS